MLIVTTTLRYSDTPLLHLVYMRGICINPADVQIERPSQNRYRPVGALFGTKRIVNIFLDFPYLVVSFLAWKRRSLRNPGRLPFRQEVSKKRHHPNDRAWWHDGEIENLMRPFSQLLSSS
jgi:hypothetical protein